MRTTNQDTAHPLVASILLSHPFTPDVEKTRDMEDKEWEYGNKDLRILMLESLATQDTQREAANSLDMFPPTFSHWLRKLSIIRQAREIRKAKKLLRIA